MARTTGCQTRARVASCLVALTVQFLVLSASPVRTGQPAAQAPTLAIRAARGLDVRTGRYIPDIVVVIKGGRIGAVGSRLEIPAGVQVIDLGDSTLLPGIVDMHTHLLLDLQRGTGEQLGMIGELVEMGTTRRSLRAVKLARELLDAGITTVRDLGNSGVNGDVALRDAIDAGWVAGPRLVAATRALAPPGAQFARMVKEAQHLAEIEYAEISGEQAARQAVKQALYDGADVIKIIVDSHSILSVEEVGAIVAEAHLHRKKVAAHATDDYPVRVAVAAGVDSVEHAYTLSDETIALMAQKGIALVPTDQSRVKMSAARRLPERDREAFRASLSDRLRRARKAGVKIVGGSDAYYAERGMTRGVSSLDMLRAYVESGLTPLEAIQTATLNASELLGPRMAVGIIESGRHADLVAVKGDPLGNIEAVFETTFVMKGGVVVKNARR